MVGFVKSLSKKSDHRGRTAIKAPELPLPAGTLQRMRVAYGFGARNNKFRLEQLATGIQEAHERGKKFFITSKL